MDNLEPTRRRGLRDYWTESIPSLSFVNVLYVTSFATGMLDSTTYADFSTFASNQTGNVILLTVSIAQLPGVRTLNSGVSLAGYLGAGLVSGRIAHISCPRRRGWVITSHIIQTLLLVVGVSLLWTQVLVSNHWALLLLLAVSSGLQVSIARTSSVAEIPTAMLSSPMIDFITDKNLFILKWNDKQVEARNRRLIYISSLVCGSLCGAFMHRGLGTEAVIATVSGIKALITLWIAFMPIAIPGMKNEATKERKEAIEQEEQKVHIGAAGMACGEKGLMDSMPTVGVLSTSDLLLSEDGHDLGSSVSGRRELSVRDIEEGLGLRRSLSTGAL